MMAKRGGGRRSVLFTIAFSLLFLGLLSAVLLTSDFLASSERSFVLARRTLRAGTLSGNAAGNIAELYGLSASVSRSAKNTTVSFQDSLPSDYSSPSAELSGYKAFFEDSLSAKLNLDATLDVSELLANPYAYASGAAVNYSYGDPMKRGLTVLTPPATVAYFLSLLYDGTQAMNDTQWSWTTCTLPCAGTDIEVRLNVTNGTGGPQAVAGCTQGCVSYAGTLRFAVNSTSPDALNVTKSAGQLAVRVASSGVSVASSLSVTVNYTNATAIYLPGSVTIANLTGRDSAVPQLVLARG